MELKTNAFADGGFIPARYTCEGENISPPFTVSGVPEGAKELVLLCDDPDAAAGVWVHWVVWGIDPNTTEIREGEPPEGSVEGETTFGDRAYGGPCPAVGTHRYRFRMFALSEPINPDVRWGLRDIERALAPHVLEVAEVRGLYRKKAEKTNA